MSMTVQDLIEVLEQMDPTAMVIISRDPEGNAYAPIEDYGEGQFDTKFSEYYEQEEEFSYDDSESPDAEADDYESPKGAVPAVVLWPAY